MRHLERSWERPAPTPEQRRRDLWLGLLIAVAAVASVEVYRSASGASVGWRGIEAYLWFAATGLVLAGRRTFPLTVLVVESLIFFVVGERLTDLGIVFTIQMTLFAALYAAWAWSRRPRSLYVVSALVLVGMFGWLIHSFATSPMQAPDYGGLLPTGVAQVVYSLAINVVYFLGAIAWGQAAYLSARRHALLEEQRDRERVIQDLERRRAVQTERVRITRDLHDVVAHHVSGIGVQAAGAGRLLAAQPDRARQAIEVIESSSRQAVQQMHQLVGLLREDDAADASGTSRDPVPGLDEIRHLAEVVDHPVVRVTEVGERFDVPVTVGAALYRIVQEAITNVRRHSLADEARVTVRYTSCDESSGGPRPEHTVEVEILDDGPSQTSSDASGGYGLDGVRERAQVLGGIADIGSRPHGGFRVRVRVPVGPGEGEAEL